MLGTWSSGSPYLFTRSSLTSPFPVSVHCCCCWVTSVVSDSVRPHRQQPTRLPHPWGSPGKNTGVGCHFLLQSMKVKSESEVAQSCPTLSDPMDCSPPGSSVHGIFQARVLGCHCLLCHPNTAILKMLLVFERPLSFPTQLLKTRGFFLNRLFPSPVS